MTTKRLTLAQAPDGGYLLPCGCELHVWDGLPEILYSDNAGYEIPTSTSLSIRERAPKSVQVALRESPLRVDADGAHRGVGDHATARPRLLDLFSGEGGAARGYADAGFEVTGIDLSPEMAYEYAEKAGRNADTAAKQAVQIAKRYPGRFIAADALSYLAEHWTEYDAFHASPPCQRYSTMANLPWIKPNHDALILATREAFQRIHAESGRPWVIENVEGARWGAKGLAKRGLEAHGMQAGFLCGAMFGLRMYRHRLFETSFLWLAPEHPKHRFRQGMPGFEAEHPGESQQAAQMVDAPFNGHDDTPFWKRGQFIEHASIKTRTELRKLPGQVRAAAGIIDGEVRKASLAAKQQGNGAQGVGVGVGHAAGWRLAAEAMGCAWMDRYGLTQAVPPRFTAWLGERLMKAC